MEGSQLGQAPEAVERAAEVQRVVLGGVECIAFADATHSRKISILRVTDAAVAIITTKAVIVAHISCWAEERQPSGTIDQIKHLMERYGVAGPNVSRHALFIFEGPPGPGVPPPFPSVITTIRQQITQTLGVRTINLLEITHTIACYPATKFSAGQETLLIERDDQNLRTDAYFGDRHIKYYPE